MSRLDASSNRPLVRPVTGGVVRAVLRHLATAIGIVLSTGATATIPYAADCVSLLAEVQRHVETPVGQDYHGIKDDRPQTVRVTSFRRGRHGGPRLVLELIGDQWVSTYSTHAYDPQGDPRWLIDGLGSAGARFFGFEMIDARTMTVPSVDEFIAALNKLNSALVAKQRAPVAITFYAPPADVVPVRAYLDAFAGRGAIPLAGDGNAMIHDLSFHSGAIFLPPAAIERKRDTVAYLEAFIAHLRAKYADQPDRAAAVAHYAYLWRFHEVRAIDNGTALVNSGLASYFNDATKRESLGYAIRHLLNDGRTPRAHVDNMIGALNERSPRFIPTYGKIVDLPKVMAALAALPPALVRADLKDFSRTFRPPARGRRGLDRSSFDEWCRELQRRRLLIIQTLSEL